MFDIRSDQWVFMSIPAQGWKYKEDHWALPKTYKKYPDRMATHRENEESIRCSYCHTEFATDPKRKNTEGTWVYVPVSKFITYRRDTNNYRCNVACMSPKDYTERQQEQDKRERAAFLLANRHLL